MTKKILCAVCGSEKVKEVRRTFTAKYNQTSVAIEGAEMYECSACGERFFTPEQARAISLTVKDTVRKQLGLLSPDEIVRIRRKLGLSQTDVEHLFGLGSKVVTRWENGRVIQSRTADIALRLLDFDRENLKKLYSLLRLRNATGESRQAAKHQSAES